MLMLANFYTFSKRKNSTKQPTGTGTELSIRLKEDTSIHNPSIVLTGNVLTYNYVYIPSFNRYYFVDDAIILTNGMTQYNLSEDVLASNKSAIGSTKAMIMRSSTGYNVWIPDNEVYVSTEKTIVHQVDSDFDVYFANPTGCYLLSVINEDGCATGFAAQYFDNASGMQALARKLMDASIIDDVMKYFSNVSNGIISLKWMPFDWNDIVASSMITLENYKIANMTLTGVSGARITGNAWYIDGSTSITIPWRSDKDFREAAPYTNAKLLIPMYGFIELNPSDFVGCTTLDIAYRLDRSTGDVVLIVKTDQGAVLQTVQFNVAVEVPIATMTRNIGGAVSAISGGINSAIGIAAGNYIGGTVGLISSAAQFALNANGRSISSKGSLQGKAATAYGNHFQIVFYAPHTLDPTNADFIATKGRPCQYVDTISNHSGYIECLDASVSVAGESTEMEEINSYLNGGFYYE